MEIKLLNDSTIFIKGKKENVLIDPTEVEINENKNTSRIVIYTNGDFNDGSLTNNEKIIIKGSGEYEIGGVEIMGVNGEDGHTIYRIVIDGFILVILGKILQELTPKRIERIDSTDILFVPTTIGEKCSFKLTKEWAKKWGANYLIPVVEDNDSLKNFLDEADEEGLEKSESLKLEKQEELPDGLEIKLLKNG
jgi:hypothetical protein